MIFLFFLALLIFGPGKLPEIARQIGRGMAEFKRASNDFRSQLEDEVRQLETEQNEIKPPATPTGSVATGPVEVEKPAASTQEPPAPNA